MQANENGAALTRVIAEAMGIHVAQRPSGKINHPIMYRLHDKDDAPVGHPGGCFFGHGWTDSEQGAWFYGPNFAENERHTVQAMDWLRQEHDILLTVRPYSVRSGHGGWRVGIYLAFPHIDEDDYTTGPAFALAVAKAIVTALQKKAENTHAGND